MTEKDAEVDIIAREREIQKPILKYEDMYKDSVCSFFLGSITVVGLYAVYKIIGLD
jgi:hypothetical protein